mgnify:CR=1 FL=1
MMPAEMEKAARGVVPSAASDSELTIYSSTSEAQRHRILGMLQTGPKHTLDFRRAGVMQSQTRIHELRRLGYDIPTAGRVTIHDDQGYPHHGVALYELVAEPVQEVAQ